MAKIMISLPQEFLRKVDRAAKAQGRSRSELIRENTPDTALRKPRGPTLLEGGSRSSQGAGAAVGRPVELISPATIANDASRLTLTSGMQQLSLDEEGRGHLRSASRRRCPVLFAPLRPTTGVTPP